MINLLPTPTSLCKVILPLWSSTISLTKVNPIPLLQCLLDIPVSNVANLSNIKLCCSLDIPIPLSSIIISTLLFSSFIEREITVEMTMVRLQTVYLFSNI